jgi:hypothetical protein
MKHTKQEEIIISRCFACHKAYLLKLMKRVKLAEPQGDGIIHQKRYLCPICHERLITYSFVQETEIERKTKEDKNENNRSE